MEAFMRRRTNLITKYWQCPTRETAGGGAISLSANSNVVYGIFSKNSLIISWEKYPWNGLNVHGRSGDQSNRVTLSTVFRWLPCLRWQRAHTCVTPGTPVCPLVTLQCHGGLMEPGKCSDVTPWSKVPGVLGFGNGTLLKMVMYTPKWF